MLLYIMLRYIILLYIKLLYVILLYISYFKLCCCMLCYCILCLAFSCPLLKNFLTLDHLRNTVVECAPSIHTDIYRTLGCPSCSTDVQMLQVSKQVKISASSITVVSF